MMAFEFLGNKTQSTDPGAVEAVTVSNTYTWIIIINSFWSFHYRRGLFLLKREIKGASAEVYRNVYVYDMVPCTVRRSTGARRVIVVIARGLAAAENRLAAAAAATTTR